MKQSDMARMGGLARAKSLTPWQASAAGRKAAMKRWGDVKRAKRLAARKAGRIAAASRKKNRGTT